jgi:hypothetical protein
MINKRRQRIGGIKRMSRPQLDYLKEAIDNIQKDLDELCVIGKDNPIYIDQAQSSNPLELWASNMLLNATIELYKVHNELHMAKRLMKDVVDVRVKTKRYYPDDDFKM